VKLAVLTPKPRGARRAAARFLHISGRRRHRRCNRVSTTQDQGMGVSLSIRMPPWGGTSLAVKLANKRKQQPHITQHGSTHTQHANAQHAGGKERNSTQTALRSTPYCNPMPRRIANQCPSMPLLVHGCHLFCFFCLFFFLGGVAFVFKQKKT
jgi:hypothetical protein